MRYKLLHLVVVVLAVVSLGGAVHHATAATPAKILTVTPATTKPVVNPGSASQGSFQILNQGGQSYAVKVYSAPYSVSGEGYTPDFTALPGRADVASWLHFDTTASDVRPGQTLTVGYTISVPAGTQPGGYYAVAFIETKAGVSQQGVVINQRVGEIFYIQVAGPVKQAGKLLSWSAPFMQRAPFSATLRLENDGGVHYASDIHVVVRDLFGRPKYTLATQKEVLPQTIRRVPVNWDKAPALGLFKVTGSVTVAGKTQSLATKYVLVASSAARISVLAIIGIGTAFALGRYAVRYRKRKNTIKP